MTDEEYKQYPPGSPRTKCDQCGEQIKTSYTFTVVVGSKSLEACSPECRAVLEAPKAVSKNSKGSAKIMKKDKAKDEQKKSKKVEEENEEEAEVEVEEDEEEVEVDEETEDVEETEEEEPEEEENGEEEEEEEPAPKAKAKKKKVVEEEEEEEPVKAKGKKMAKASAKGKKDEEPPKKKKKLELYKYRDGSTLQKLFKRISDGKWHPKQELFKGLKNPEVGGRHSPFRRITERHAQAFGWDFSENTKTGQVKLVVPKADRDVILGLAEAE